MLTVLIVAASGSSEAPLEVSPSIEVLHAGGLEEALETLGRNRRIDAILLWAGRENTPIARAIREDNPAPAPIFATEPSPAVGVRVLNSRSLPEAVEELLQQIS